MNNPYHQGEIEIKMDPEGVKNLKALLPAEPRKWVLGFSTIDEVLKYKVGDTVEVSGLDRKVTKLRVYKRSFKKLRVYASAI